MYGFKLTQEMQDAGFHGGTVNCNPVGYAFDVGKALEEGKGVIATEDANLASVLNSYPALESVPENEIPKEAKPVVIPAEVGHIAPNVGPPDLQGAPPVVTEGAPLEIPAEHADEPTTEEEAVQQGEAVSGDREPVGAGSSRKSSRSSESGTKE